MSRRVKIVLLLMLGLFVTACATTPKFDVTGVDLAITPNQAVTESETLRGRQVLWGGVIVASANLKEETQLEILAYPLNSSQRPDAEQAPLGRFLALRQGYLETSDFAQGRTITLQGELQGTRSGKIGEAEYRYPVLRINQHYLWRMRYLEPETRFHIGIGVMIHN